MYYLNDKNILNNINKIECGYGNYLYVYADNYKYISVEYNKDSRIYTGFHITIKDGNFVDGKVNLVFNHFSELYHYIMKTHYNV